LKSAEREAEERLVAEYDCWQLEEAKISVWLQRGEDKDVRSLYSHKKGNPLLGLYSYILAVRILTTCRPHICVQLKTFNMLHFP